MSINNINPVPEIGPPERHAGFKPNCPLCGVDDAAIYVSLVDPGELKCDDCGGDFRIDFAVAHFTRLAERWQAIARWIETAPTRKEGQ